MKTLIFALHQWSRKINTFHLETVSLLHDKSNPYETFMPSEYHFFMWYVIIKPNLQFRYNIALCQLCVFKSINSIMFPKTEMLRNWTSIA